MRLDDEQESSNIEDRTSRRGGMGLPGMGGGGMLPLGGGKIGCGTILIILVAVLVFKVDPTQIVGGMNGGAGGGGFQPQSQTTAPSDPQTQELKTISAKVLGSTERRWQAMFAEAGQQYPAPTLVFYSQRDQSGCGAAMSAMGPFYCPADQKIYIDTDFFKELERKMNVPGDFPIGYVIAHEVGHHIQTITGISEKVRRAQQRASEADANALQVRMELQADCYAGVWAARDTNLMEPGDLEEGMRAAHAIGDDTLMRNAGRNPVESMFTHGTSEQRMAWLRRGLQTGDPNKCDTFVDGV